MRSIGLCLSLALVSSAGATEPLAFYSFTGTAGESVSTVSNLGTGGATYDGTAAVATGGAVTYSDDVPAKYLCADVNATTALSTDWKSVEFTTSGSNGGCISVPGLGGAICEAGVSDAFTVEFFVKFETSQSWRNLFKFWYKSASSSSQLAKYVLWDSAFGLQMNSSNPTTVAAAAGRWYHLAAVYTAQKDTEGTITNGVWRMYRNGGLFATQKGAIMGASSTTVFKIGGDGTTFETFAGKIAALRVTPAALATDQFLRARKRLDGSVKEGVLGFWSFTDGQPGEAAKLCEKDSGDPFDALVGAACGSSGSIPVFSDDVPGPVVFESVTNLTPLATNAQSVAFTGGSLSFPSLCARLAAAGAFTIEFFGKMDASYTWRNFFAMTLNGSQSVKFADRTLSEYSTQIGAEYNASLRYTSLNCWHHFALVWDAESKNFETYADHAKIKTIGGISLSGSATGYFGCENGGGAGELLVGKIFGLRISTKRLTPLDMLSAGPRPVEARVAKTVFHWDFEDAGSADGTGIALEGAKPVHGGYFNALGLSSSGSRIPTYSTEIANPDRPFVVQRDGLVTTNGYSARFYGYYSKYGETTYEDSWAGSRLESVREATTSNFPYNPTNFTFEMFLKRDNAAGAKHTGINGEMLATFGNSGCDGSYRDWVMSFYPAYPYAFNCSVYDEDGTGYGLNPGLHLLDGRWHHLALVYDNDARTATLYIDRVKVAGTTLSKPLRRTNGYHYGIGRGQNMSGFNGWIDDVRLTDGVLEPSRFLRKSAAGTRGFALLLR